MNLKAPYSINFIAGTYHQSFPLLSFCRHFTCFTDCAIYFNQVFADKGSGRAVATLLIDSHLMNLLDDPEQQAEQPQLAKAIQQAQDSGVEISTMLRFYTTWKSQNSQVMKS